MGEPWDRAAARRGEFDAGALAYDLYRPRYPEELFDAIVGAVGDRHATVLEIGAGTGIASEPLARRGFRLIALEPAPAMAAIARRKLAGESQVLMSTFEDYDAADPVDAVAAFTSWHWIDPALGVPKIAGLLRPGGVLALVWTELIRFDPEPFGRRSGYADRIVSLAEAIEPLLEVFDDHEEFTDCEVERFRFERVLDADTFLAEQRTYPGPHDDDHDAEVRSLIDGECGGAVTKVEDAVLYLYRRL